MSETEDPFDRETRGRAFGRLRVLAKKAAAATQAPESVLIGADPVERRIVERAGLLGIGRKVRRTVALTEHRWSPGGWRLHGRTLENREEFTGRPGAPGTEFLFDSYVSREVWLRRNGQLEICDIDFRRLASTTLDPTVGRRSVGYAAEPKPATVNRLIFFEKSFMTSQSQRGGTMVSYQDQRRFNWTADSPFAPTFNAVQRLLEGHATDHPADSQFYWY